MLEYVNDKYNWICGFSIWDNIELCYLLSFDPEGYTTDVTKKNSDDLIGMCSEF